MVVYQKILARWYYRLLLFLSLCFGYYITAVFTYPATFLTHEAILVLFLLCVSFLIEGCRAGGKFVNVGFILSKDTFFEIIIGTLYAVIPQIFTIVLAAIIGATIHIQSIIDISSLYLAFTTMLFIAVFEELMFRGIVFQSLYERFGSVAASISVSLVFGIAHLLNPHISFLAITNVVLAGILLSTMYIATKNLWMPISFHLTWNFTLESVLNSPVSGITHNNTSLFLIDWNIVNAQYPLLFGGDFGIEGGIVTTVFLVLLIIIVIRFHSPSPYTIAHLYRRYFAEQQLLSHYIVQK
ncbi:MAG: CPBP family intramembrane metalloprotease [Niabella sp.]|nr:CPBP family intramembrane metalloprotease [Ignavibacteria bacterium]TXI32848.1 MAG: CPBP family intramembrane metalloprotease [Niabella sp.]